MTEQTISSQIGTGRRPRRLSDGMFALLLTAPGLALLAAVVVYPLITALITAFYKQSLVEPGREFVGFQNIVDVLTGEFFPLLTQTLVFTLGTTIAPFVIGFGLALALNTRIRGAKVLRGLMLIPWLIPGVVVSFLWMWIFNANYGVLNAALETVGLIDSPQAWLANPTTAMIAVIVAKTWQSFPWMMVMLLAGLQTVPIELHEAAEIDGAGTIRRFFSITVPQMSGIIGLVILLEFIWNFQHFDIIYVLTGGGPAGSTQTFATAVYETAFDGFDLGHAGAIGLLWMILLMALVVVYVRLSEKGEKR
ncbi:sugar ABC transporter permease [Microbacterium sp. NPDC089313]|jgi:multiple sugar transport system permease protein|uniref:Carbohydrate ABC transporter membrane protein 1, CUT1 family n=2 Tax=Microbacterium paraoxydans TaxID=199592 RepID=A0A1H1RGX8_9MICO|nr:MULTISPECIES: sugar ABC transporter permease [unclassified Microbacterium]AMG82714.1 ABC transporter permease [Microbacterium sp. PAMC 28756]AVL98313.1 sugar ABC transporter permease [Microbacterium sp. str. 'China']KYJ97343.1 ABC transporter permease [Microbacterium sp. CH1]MPT15771.1 sugar ABC transporter permease [Microbacterium sp.]OIJ32280.1 ABC transporter permease [Microbacterium sp. LCT-H2]PMC02883.1 sn-glycerol-3-phosphate ABC transporter permease UgpA [Microbacterium sp. UMB0228]